MRVKFHIPKRTPALRVVEEFANSEGDPSEGPTYAEGPIRSEGSAEGIPRYGSEGEGGPRPRPRTEPEQRSPRRSNRFNALKAPSLPVKKQVFTRSRKIETTVLSNKSQVFGSFEDMVTMSNEGLDIVNVNQAKKMLKDTGLVPVTLKFFVDTSEIKDKKITSAEVSFEKPSGNESLPTYTGAIIAPAHMNLEFNQAAARRKQKVLQTMYVNFENIYDINEEIEYSVAMSQNRLKLTEKIPAFASSNFINKVVKEPVQIPLPTNKIVESYSGYYRNWSLGRGLDPGAEINALPGTSATPAQENAAGFAQHLVGTKTFLNAGSGGSAPVGPTGTGLLNNKMGSHASSLVRRTTDIRTKTVVGFKSRLMPIVVTANIPRLKYNTNIQVRIKLRSDNSLTDQIVAAGSKIYKIDDKYRVCLLPIEAPSMKATAQGSGLVEITTQQNDPAGSHVTIFSKFFNKNGSSSAGWLKFKTFLCSKTAMTILDFSKYDYDFVALRAVSTNGLGYGSKYSAASVPNWRPVTISENDTIIGSPEKMPIVCAVNNSISARLILENLEQCTQVTVIREDLSTGLVSRVASSIINGKNKLTKYDKSVRIGATYRYFIVYKTAESGETQLISYKDDVYTHLERSPESSALSLKPMGYETSVGTDLTLTDDIVTIGMRVNIKKSGLKRTIQMINSSGIANIAQGDIAKVLKNFDKFFASRTTRINIKTGKREILSMQPIDLERSRFQVVDSPMSRSLAVDSAITGPVPGGKYIYITRIYYTDFSTMLGRDSGSESPAQNPGLSQSVIKSPSRRFFITSNTLRSIMPSEDFVGNDENYNDINDGYERNFTGIEIVTTVSIPEENNFIKNVTIEKITDQVMTLTWDYGGDPDSVDHFVILEKSFGKIVPVGAKIAFTTVGKHAFHISEHEPEYDKTYIVKAYNNEGEEIASDESPMFIPSSIIPNDIMKIHSLNALQIPNPIRNVLL
jgi:hypothetical protein